jgi:hypothetical protein
LALHAQLGNLFEVVAGARTTTFERGSSGVDSPAQPAMRPRKLDDIVERVQEHLGRLHQGDFVEPGKGSD